MAKTSISSLGSRAARLYISEDTSLQPGVVFTGWSADGGYQRGDLSGSLRALKLESGSRKETPLGNGRVQETFTVFGYNTSQFIIENSERLEALFAVAARDSKLSAPVSTVRLYERVRDEDEFRSARIYSGSITRVDDNILDYTMNADKAKLIVTLERDELWKQLSNRKSVTKELGAHGGYVKVRSDNHGPAEGEIDISLIRTDGGKVNRVWWGIKMARGKELAGWNPKVQVETGTVMNVSPRFSITPETDSSATGYLGGKGISVTFRDNSDVIDNDWRWRFRVPIYRWNTYANDRLNRHNYEGTYKLLLRYKTDVSPDAVYGIQGGIGWDDVATVSDLQPQWLSWTEGDFQYVDLGEFTLSGPIGSHLQGRAFPSQLSIWLGFGLFGDVDKDYREKIFVDDMVLMPVDKLLYIDTPRALEGGERIEVYQSSDNVPYGYIVEEFSDGTPIGGVPNTQHRINSVIPTIETRNWTWPTSSGNMLVHVADKEPGTGSKYTTGKTTISVQITPRGKSVIKNRRTHQVG